MRRGAGVAVALAVAIFALGGWSRLRVDNSPGAWLDPASPAVAAWREGAARFGPDDFLLFVRPDVEPFDASSWRDQRALGAALRADDRFSRVADLPSVSAKLGMGGDEPTPLDRRARLASSPMLAGRLIGRDGRGVAVAAWSEGGDSASRAALFRDAGALALKHGGWVVAGPLAFNARLDELTRADSARVVAAMAMVALFGAALALRSWAGAFAALAGAAWTVGAWFAALGWFGRPVSAAAAAALPLLAIVGVENSLHVWMGAAEASSFRGSARRLARPLFAANATTAFSLAALALSPLLAIRVAGLTLPIAIAASHAWASFVLPRALDRWGVARPSRRSRGALRGACASMASFGARRRWLAIGCCGALIAAGAFAATRLPSETNIALQLAEDSTLAGDLRAVESTLGGSLPLAIEFEPTAGDPFSALRTADSLAERLRRDPRVAAVASPGDFLALAAGEAPGDSAFARRAAEAAALALAEPAESLFHAPSGVARAEVLLPQLPSEELLALLRDHGVEFGGAAGGARATGVAALMLMAQRDLLLGQFQGMAISFALVVACLFAFFRRLRPAFASIPPNALPVAVAALALRAMAWPLDFASAQLAAMIFGLSVNGTLYLAGAAKSAGGDVRRIAARFASMGPSVALAGAMAAAAFSCAMLSELASIRNLGAIAAVACLSATLADLVALPALLRSSSSDM